jgi:hypothetical protein
MLILLMFLGFFTSVVFSAMPHYVASFAAPIHQACQHVTPSGPHSGDYQSLICGSHLEHDTLRAELLDAGLLHLMIVSGSHLLFLERILQKILARQTKTGWVIWPLLLLFTFANGCEPRIVRALFGVVINRVSDYFQLRWNSPQVVTLAGFVALPFCMNSASVFGLLTSWTAALAVSGFSHHFPWTPQQSRMSRSIALQTRLYLLLAPFLLRMTLPNPTSIIYNVTVAPLLALILFPASLLAFVLPPFVPITDFLWSILRMLFESCAFLIPPPIAQNLKLPQVALVSYLVALTVCAWLPANCEEP